MRACDETYLRDLRGSASVGNCVRSSLGHACACCFHTRGDTCPVVSVPLTQSLSKALGGRIKGCSGAKWPSLLIMVLVSATGQPPNPDRYTTCSNQWQTALGGMHGAGRRSKQVREDSLPSDRSHQLNSGRPPGRHHLQTSLATRHTR